MTVGGGIVQHLEPRPDLCTNTITCVQKDNVLIFSKSEGVKDSVSDDITMLGGLQAHQKPRSDGICPCVNSAAGMGGGQTPIAFRPGFRVRKLTQRECWRLMGFCDDQFDRARKAMNEKIYNGNDKCGSQLYKQAGNSIVVDVLEHIMENLYDAMPYLFDDMVVGSFFSGIGAFEAALTRFDPMNGEKQTGEPTEDVELRQLGYINNYNGDANRIYDGSGISRALKAEAGGGGAKTGWYSVPKRDDTGRQTDVARGQTARVR